MENTKAKNVIIVVLILLLLCCLGYMVWQYVTLNNITNKPEVDVQQSEVNIQKLDVNSKLIEELHSYVPKKYGCRLVENAYQDKKVTLNDLSNDLILLNAFEVLEIKEEDKIVLPEFKDEEYPYNYEWYGFKPEVLQKNVKEMYGQTVKDESFSGGAFGCNLVDGQYNYSYGGSCGCCSDIEYITITNAYKKGDEIYIEDKYMLVECNDEVREGECGDSILSVYDSSNKTTKIGQVKHSFGNNDNMDLQIKQYEPKAQKYRHTYKLGENQTYYWYSSEPIMD